MKRFFLAPAVAVFFAAMPALALDQTDVRTITCGALLEMSPALAGAVISEADGYLEGLKGKAAKPTVPASDADLDAGLKILAGVCSEKKKTLLVDLIQQMSQ